ncbi:MAG: hypothetical protein GY938_29420 [Ketobacter sp.]|nr:hypothetical protein [Ketobacter sp.]
MRSEDFLKLMKNWSFKPVLKTLSRRFGKPLAEFLHGMLIEFASPTPKEMQLPRQSNFSTNVGPPSHNKEIKNLIKPFSRRNAKIQDKAFDALRELCMKEPQMKEQKRFVKTTVANIEKRSWVGARVFVHMKKVVVEERSPIELWVEGTRETRIRGLKMPMGYDENMLYLLVNVYRGIFSFGDRFVRGKEAKLRLWHEAYFSHLESLLLEAGFDQVSKLFKYEHVTSVWKNTFTFYPRLAPSEWEIQNRINEMALFAFDKKNLELYSRMPLEEQLCRIDAFEIEHEKGALFGIKGSKRPRRMDTLNQKHLPDYWDYEPLSLEEQARRYAEAHLPKYWCAYEPLPLEETHLGYAETDSWPLTGYHPVPLRFRDSPFLLRILESELSCFAKP